MKNSCQEKKQWSEETIYKEKFANHIFDKGLISTYIRTQFSSNKTKYFPKNTHTNGQQVYEIGICSNY
jgi:hypothetical protein